MRVGVIGGAGYTAGELLRLLVNHPAAEIAFVHSDSNAGNALGDVHGGLLGETDLRFTAEYDLGAIDVLFSARRTAGAASSSRRTPCPKGCGSSIWRRISATSRRASSTDFPN